MTGPSQAGFKSKLSHFLNQTLNPVRGIKRQALCDSVKKKGYGARKKKNLEEKKEEI